MKIVIFGGTSEGRRLSHALADAGAEVVVSVVSDYGAEEQGSHPRIRIRTGPLRAEEKLQLLEGAALCVDATHPYASHVTISVRQACEEADIPCLRLQRAPSQTGDAPVLDSAAEAAAFLTGQKGNILLTTGVKELPAFTVLEPERLYPRVLPSRESIAACEAAGIPRRNIIAMQGPFSEEMNTATIRQYNIRWLVTKDGGIPGGFPEKAAAARETGAKLLILRRPDDSGCDYSAILNQCLALLRSETNIERAEGEQP